MTLPDKIVTGIGGILGVVLYFLWHHYLTGGLFLPP